MSTTIAAPRSAAQERIIEAALNLFARHGVGGTSLQMIADEIGVTKAAVYHQYNTKDEIIIAAAEAELGKLQSVIEKCEREPSGKRARDSLLVGIVDLAVEHRGPMSAVLNDPVIVAFFAEHKMHRDIMQRLQRILIGEGTGPEGRVRLVMLTGAISGAAIHPWVIGLDEEVLRRELLHLARRFLGLPTR